MSVVYQYSTEGSNKWYPCFNVPKRIRHRCMYIGTVPNTKRRNLDYFLQFNFFPRVAKRTYTLEKTSGLKYTIIK